MRYRRLDLNLLVALGALLGECSVSRTAERLHLGQSATSAALGRLRKHFNDPLLVQVGRRLEATVLGLELLPKVREALALTREIVEAPVHFKPANCTRQFTLVASDYVAAVLLPAVSRELVCVAPGVRLSLADYCAAEHVVRKFADGRNLAMDAAHLQELGIERKVGVAVESLALMPEFIVDSAQNAGMA